MSRAIALLLTVLTGFSGLVYEVAWQRYVATLLGSHSEATAAVLALFLGGLSLGYALFGRVTRLLVERGRRRGRPPRLLWVYGVVEAGIGLHALAFPLLFRAVQALSFAIPHEAGGLGFVLDVALTALLVLPPTVLMGGTIPLLTQALSDSVEDATRIHAFIYAFNTAGAFVGALAAGFALIPWLGLQWVVVCMGLINLGAGAAFLAMGRRPRAVRTVEVPGQAPRLGVYAAVALLVGFAAMTFQTVLIRLGGLALGSSNFTFSMVVAVFVLCIALGSFAVSALPRVPKGLLPGSQWALLGLMAWLYPALQDSPYWAHLLRSLFRDDDAAFYPYHLSVFAAVLAVLLIPIGLSGAALPLLFDRLKREVGELGAAAGRLYAWNTVGSLLGALLGGYLLLFWLDLDQVFRVGLAAVAASAVILTARLYELGRLPSAAFVLAPALAGVWLLGAWAPERLSSGLFRVRQPTAHTGAGADAFFAAHSPETRVVFYRDDPNSSVAVKKIEVPGSEAVDLSVVTNGKPDGSIRTDYPTMALAALIPALFAEQLERGFVIGYGTGVTVGELAALDSVERVVVAEISPGVIDGAPLFERYNQRALANPKTEVVVADAYRALLRSDEKYDVIASEPSNPWVTGVEMLFSRDFLEAARSRLRPGGVYAQWFHTYENDEAVVELVLRTYASVFDHVAVWYALGPDLILLGFESDERALDLDALRQRALRPDIAAGLRRSGIRSLPALLGHELLPLGVVDAARFQGDVHTILHPVLSHRAARAFFRGQQADLPSTARPRPDAVGRRNSLLLRYGASQEGGLDEEDFAAVAGEACRSRPPLCATVMSAWLRFFPGSEERTRRLAALRDHPYFADALDPTLLQALSQLYAPGAVQGLTPSATGAARMTDLYESYFYHAMPFSRAALAALWRLCVDGDDPGSCQRGLAAAEAQVGPLTRTAARRPGPD